MEKVSTNKRLTLFLVLWTVTLFIIIQTSQSYQHVLKHSTSHYSESPNSELINETEEALSDSHFDTLSDDDPSLLHERYNENKFSGRKFFCCPTTAKGWCAFKVRLWFNDPCAIVIELKRMKHILHNNHDALQAALGFDPGDLENFLPFINFILENINDIHTKPQYNLCPRSICPPCEISPPPATLVPNERCPPMVECPLTCSETSRPACPEISNSNCPKCPDISTIACPTHDGISNVTCPTCGDTSPNTNAAWTSVGPITCPSLPAIPTCPPQSQNWINIPNYLPPPLIIPTCPDIPNCPPSPTIPTCPKILPCPPQFQNLINISNCPPPPIIPACPKIPTCPPPPIIPRCPEIPTCPPQFQNLINISNCPPAPTYLGCPTCPPPPNVP
ncbi:hypothetical protein PV326_004956, partial [Microctonus aethiopoides]